MSSGDIREKTSDRQRERDFLWWVSERNCKRGGSWEEKEEEKISPVPPGYRGMKDGEMERRRDV